jgi:UDP-2,3-diacylglucosamine pyrophosphatase LpxH
MQPAKYRSVFISDVHLGSRACQADHVCDFLKTHTCHSLYLVGDIIDFWKLKRGEPYWPQSHSNVIRRILTASKRGTQVKYVIGNHDDVLREWFSDLMSMWGNIQVADQFDHVCVNGETWLVTHGDLFDGVIRYHRWLSVLGDQAYGALLWLNHVINQIRRGMGKDYWSFSNYIKVNTKQAVAFVTKFEEQLKTHSLKAGYTGVVCGHIHTPQIIQDPGFTYVNTGDWCETLSAVVETWSGDWQLMCWDTQTSSLKCIKEIKNASAHSE